MDSFSKGTFLIALIVLTEILAEHPLSLLKEEQKDRQKLNIASVTRQHIKAVSTLRWQYTDEPNTLVFDFEELNVSKHDIVQLVESNIPPNTRYHISKYANSNYLVSVSLECLQDNQEEHLQTIIRHKQLFSILKYRGLYIKQLDVLLCPTLGLCSTDTAVNFWRFEVLDLSRSALDYDPTELKAQVAREITCTIGKNLAENALLIHSKDIGVSNKKNGSVVLLAQEILMKKNSHHLDGPIKKLIYIPFLRSYFPLIATKITPFRKVFHNRIIEHQ
ncbi:hypothetical protein A0J61_08555 [Choanephora cucurbitarum]|uniref:Uncharacterized protein n=1 Tax=Choanephora cucurbitarum TaxID=101091 RepID=A0A1C7N7U2_9FUNG|nr:hypothetical protein A0J61_08555 [Choanephora cucurbitarum]